MKRYEFEVVIPNAVFDHVTCVTIEDLLRWFVVDFTMIGCSDSKTEYLVVSHSRELARAAYNLLFSIRHITLISAYSPQDKQCCKPWFFGELRETNF